MAPREARVFAEGSLRWVQASGTGGWNTASAPVSALVGFVQAGLAWTSAANIATVKERGVPHHHKRMGQDAVEVTFTYLQAVTANMATPATGTGVSTRQAHFELRHQVDEDAPGSGLYWNFQNGVLLSRGFNEGDQGNQLKETWRFLAMVGPTASGYLG